jgi:hypothetical protein
MNNIKTKLQSLPYKNQKERENEISILGIILLILLCTLLIIQIITVYYSIRIWFFSVYRSKGIFQFILAIFFTPIYLYRYVLSNIN